MTELSIWQVVPCQVPPLRPGGVEADPWGTVRDAAIDGDPFEQGVHNLRLNFVDADGRSIMPDFPPIPIEVALPEDMHFGTRNFIINIQQLKFESPGLYSIDIALDSQSHSSIPLLVKHNPPSGG